jgi:hypothetical protein
MNAEILQVVRVFPLRTISPFYPPISPKHNQVTRVQLPRAFTTAARKRHQV